MNLSEHENLEACVLSSLMQGGDAVKALCEEFDLRPSDFTGERVHLFRRLMSSMPMPVGFDVYWRYRDYVPTAAANARYYVEMLHENIHGRPEAP